MFECYRTVQIEIDDNSAAVVGCKDVETQEPISFTEAATRLEEMAPDMEESFATLVLRRAATLRALEP